MPKQQRQCLLTWLIVFMLAACTDQVGTVIDIPIDRGEIVRTIAATNHDDPALQMRASLRSMPTGEYLALVERSNNVVLIGFRSIGAERGVSRLGASLVSDQEKTGFLELIETHFADEVLYRFKHIPAAAVRLKTSTLASDLRELPWVDYVAPSSDLVTPDVQTPCSPISSPQVIPWHISRVRANDAWSIATGDAPKHLILLDDGADEGGGWHGQELFWSSYTFYTPSTANDGTHGTPVLGAAQARDNSVGTVGVAPTAIARVAKIFDPNDPHWEIYAALAIDDKATLATVMTISYSSKQTSPTPLPTMVGVHDAILNAYYQHGVLFTASTGNQAASNIYSYPARFDEVIGVGGSGYNDEYVLNNYAPGNVELAAPALDILTVCKSGQIGSMTGTSFATPKVAGAVMLLREVFPNISNDSLRARLRNTAVPMADPLKSGAGRLDVAAALQSPPPPPPPPPPFRVTIEGPGFPDPSVVRPFEFCLYKAIVEHGTPPYTFEWEVDGSPVGSTQDIWYAAGNDDFDIWVIVTDANNTIGYGFLEMTVDQLAGECLAT